MSIYIGNLPYEATTDDIRAHFREYGEAVSCTIPRDHKTGQPRGFGFIELADLAIEERAIEELQNVILRGRPLRLAKGVRRDAQPARVVTPPRRIVRPDQPNTPRVPRQPAPEELNRPGGAPRWAAGVPMEYRAQIQGRCQRQRVNRPRAGDSRRKSDVEVWLEEWNAGRSSDVPFQTEGLRILGADQPIQIAWRLASNSGIDDDLSRPVIGAGGWPLIPGSSIKGMFRRACTDDALRLRWCGGPRDNRELKQGILRFHGAWPVRDADQGWRSRLLDVVHPQERWQVGFHADQGQNRSSAFSLISLYRPRLLIAISCTEVNITEDEWSEIEATMRRALSAGIGGKTSAGYGAIELQESHAERAALQYQDVLDSAAVDVPTSLASPRRNTLVAFLRKAIRRLLRFLQRRRLLRPWLGRPPVPPEAWPQSVNTAQLPSLPERLDSAPPQVESRPAIADLPSGLVFQCGIKGQGPASLLLDGSPEFRPSMFRAAVRSMALRLFGGLTDQATAKRMVGHLFGSLTSPPGQRGPTVGLLRMHYLTEPDGFVSIGPFGPNNTNDVVFATSGRLVWTITRELRKQEDMQALRHLLGSLHALTLALGGFGRGWRRPDHRIFLPSYTKRPIGCHWEWTDPTSLAAELHVRNDKDLVRLLQYSRDQARQFLKAVTGKSAGNPSPWREVIHPDYFRIWWRLATEATDVRSVHWFHSSAGDPSCRSSLALKNSVLAGQLNQVGLLWCRCLPIGDPLISTAAINVANPGRNVFIDHSTGPFLELLTLVDRQLDRDARKDIQRFEQVMDSGAAAGFQRVNWHPS